MRGELKAYIITEVFDREGKLVSRKRRRSKSFLQAFLGILFTQIKSGSTQALPDTGGTSRTVYRYASNFDSYALAANATLGVVVGTDPTSVAANQYSLGVQIAHGNTSGKMMHGTVVFTALDVGNIVTTFSLYRDFLNSSGATITVYEFGIYASGYASPTTYCFCIVRDIDAGGCVVPDGYNIRVTYQLKTEA